MKRIYLLAFLICLTSSSVFAADEVYLDTTHHSFKKHTINNQKSVPTEKSYYDEESDEALEDYIGNDEEVEIPPILQNRDSIENSNSNMPQFRFYNSIFPGARF